MATIRKRGPNQWQAQIRERLPLQTRTFVSITTFLDGHLGLGDQVS